MLTDSGLQPLRRTSDYIIVLITQPWHIVWVSQLTNIRHLSLLAIRPIEQLLQIAIINSTFPPPLPQIVSKAILYGSLQNFTIIGCHGRPSKSVPIPTGVEKHIPSAPDYKNHRVLELELATEARLYREALLWGTSSRGDDQGAEPGVRASSCPGGGAGLRSNIESDLQSAGPRLRTLEHAAVAEKTITRSWCLAD